MSKDSKKAKREEWLSNLIDESLQEATNEVNDDNHNFAMKMLKAGDKCPNCGVSLVYDTFSRTLTCNCDLIQQ